MRGVSIPPWKNLPDGMRPRFHETSVLIKNTTSLSAAREMIANGHRPLVLNFASGTMPGGGFLSGSRAQEEYLCRSSALFASIKDDEMYTFHRWFMGNNPGGTEWAILSENVPVFRKDNGNIEDAWTCDFITCAAPHAGRTGLGKSAVLLGQKILRVLDIASAFQYSALVLGAWGCGAYENDPYQTALDFHHTISWAMSGHFSDVIFAISDWSADRRFLSPFCDAFGTMSPMGDY